jgi:hypothetical protein
MKGVFCMELTAENVNKIFLDCLFKEKPLKEGTEYIPVVGVANMVGFIPDKVKEHSLEIKELLDQLHENFNESVGGGWSFLKAPFTKDDVQWGEHRNADELLMLGLASGCVQYQIEDRNMWALLPGNMPYFMVLNNQLPVTTKVVGK